LTNVCRPISNSNCLSYALLKQFSFSIIPHPLQQITIDTRMNFRNVIVSQTVYRKEKETNILGNLHPELTWQKGKYKFSALSFVKDIGSNHVRFCNDKGEKSKNYNSMNNWTHTNFNLGLETMGAMRKRERGDTATQNLINVEQKQSEKKTGKVVLGFLPKCQKAITFVGRKEAIEMIYIKASIVIGIREGLRTTYVSLACHLDIPSWLILTRHTIYHFWLTLIVEWMNIDHWWTKEHQLSMNKRTLIIIVLKNIDHQWTDEHWLSMNKKHWSSINDWTSTAEAEKE